MLGFFLSARRGDGDLLLATVADRLTAMGWPLAGAVQINREIRPDHACRMDLAVLRREGLICISQTLGAGSRGCRLDSAALEKAVGLVEAGMAAHPPRLLILNKFGKAEAEGRGFRLLMGQALAVGIPVLTGVNPRNLPAFQAFADGLAQELPPDESVVLDWCRNVAGRVAGRVAAP